MMKVRAAMYLLEIHSLIMKKIFLSRKQRELLFRNADVKLAQCPLHKSCFICLQKKCYQFFCATCKKAYNDFFEKNLHTFSSYFTKNE